MKIRSVLIMLMFVLAFTACKKDSITYRMTANIDEEEWKTLTPIVTLSDNKLTILGTSIAGKIISIVLLGTDEKKYEISSVTSFDFTAFYKASASIADVDAYLAYEGVVEVTKIDTKKKQLSATFEFKCTKSLTGDIINITEGEIKGASYIEK